MDEPKENQRTKRTKNPKTLVSWRVTPETERQIEELRAWLGGSKSGIMLLAVDRMYQQEARRRGAESGDGE